MSQETVDNTDDLSPRQLAELPHVTLTKRDWEHLLEQAAARGAERVLHDLNLQDDSAAKDLSELRDLLEAWKAAKSTVWTTLWRALTLAVLGILAAYFYTAQSN